jgi:hypothetical protein
MGWDGPCGPSWTINASLQGPCDDGWGGGGLGGGGGGGTLCPVGSAFAEAAGCGGPAPPAPPPQITLQQIDSCIYPNGIGITALTGTFTLEVQYQVLVNGQPVYGNDPLNRLGVSISESVTTTSGNQITGNGRWCPVGGTCGVPDGSMTSSGTFWDMLAGGPGTANQTFMMNGQSLSVSFPSTSVAQTVLKNTYNSPGQSISVGNGALAGTSATRQCGKNGDPGQ